MHCSAPLQRIACPSLNLVIQVYRSPPPSNFLQQLTGTTSSVMFVLSISSYLAHPARCPSPPRSTTPRCGARAWLARRARCDPSADPHQYHADAAHKYARRKCCSRCVPLVYFAPHLFTPLPRQTSAHSPKKPTLRAATRHRTTLMVQPCAAHTFPSCCLTDSSPPLAADQAVVVPQASKKKRNK